MKISGLLTLVLFVSAFLLLKVNILSFIAGFITAVIYGVVISE